MLDSKEEVEGECANDSEDGLLTKDASLVLDCKGEKEGGEFANESIELVGGELPTKEEWLVLVCNEKEEVVFGNVSEVTLFDPLGWDLSSCDLSSLEEDFVALLDRG
jgi:hypothetical protein